MAISFTFASLDLLFVQNSQIITKTSSVTSEKEMIADCP